MTGLLSRHVTTPISEFFLDLIAPTKEADEVQQEIAATERTLGVRVLQLLPSRE